MHIRLHHRSSPRFVRRSRERDARKRPKSCTTSDTLLLLIHLLTCCPTCTSLELKLGLLAPDLGFRKARLPPQPLEIRLALLLGPLQDQMPTQQMGVFERGESRLGIASRGEIEEGEPSGLVVELAREADGFQLTVGAVCEVMESQWKVES